MTPPRHPMTEHGGTGRRKRLPKDDPRYCNCDICRQAHNAWHAEYRAQVVADVKAGKRPAPKWLLHQQERARLRNERELVANQPGRQAAAKVMGRAIAHVAQLMANPGILGHGITVELEHDPHKVRGRDALTCTIRIEVEI